jgi:fibronectin-binding autotransporter adhesin
MKTRFANTGIARITLALTAGCFALHSVAQAATYYWDNNTTTAGFGTAGSTWSSAGSTLWNNDLLGGSVGAPNTLGTSITTTTSDALNFGTASAGLSAGTITVSGTVSANSLTFGSASGAILLSGGTINLGGTTPTITVNNTTNTISSGITGSAGLTKAGTGALRIQVGSDYTGATTINGGKLQINNTSGSVNWTPGLIYINNGSTLEFTGAGQTIMSGATDNITFDSNGGGSMVMTKNTIWRNASIITTGGAKNTVSGTYFNGQAAGGSNRVIYGVAAGTDLGGIDLEVSSEHRNVGGITKNGNGTLALTNNTNAMGAGATIIINAGTVEIGGAGRLENGSYAGAITNNGTFNYNSSAAQTLSGVISGNGALVKSNASTLTLSGANTYTGATTLNQGTITFGTGTLATTTGALSVNNTNTTAAGTAAVLNLSTAADTTTGSLSGSISAPISGTNTATINTQTGRTLTVNQTADDTYAGVIAGAGNFTLGSLSTNTLTLTGTNTYTGGTTVSAGTLRLLNSAGGDAILGSGHNYVVASGATLEFNRTAGIENISTFNLSGAGTFKTSGTAPIVQTSLGSTVAMGSGALFHVESGSYQFGAGGIGSWSSNLSDMQVDSGATFDGAATPTVVNALNGSGTVLTGGGITLGVDNGSGTFSGVIGNSSSGGSAFSITKVGSGTQTLSGANTYTGSTNIDGGFLRISYDTDLKSFENSAFNINNSSTLVFVDNVASGLDRTKLTGSTFTFGANGGSEISLEGGNHLIQGGGATFTTNGGLKNTISSIYSGDINNQGSGNTVFNVADGSDEVDLEISAAWTTTSDTSGVLTKNGAGTMAFTGDHTGNEAIEINAGTLEIGGSSRLNSGAFTNTITNDGVFKYNSTTDQTLSGVISGTGALTQSGASTLTLTGANTYTGATTVNAGTLFVNGELGGTNVSVSANAHFGGTGMLGGDLTFDGSSFLDIVNIGDALAITGDVTFGSGFGLDNITSWDYQNAVAGTYTLLSGSGINLANMDNVGLVNALNLDNGNLAYFQTGSLQVVIAIPEPSPAAFIGGIGMLLLLRRRR